MIGHGIGCVPDVVQFDRRGLDGVQLVQTYDAGVTVDQWATLLPVTRDGRVYHHVFEDCAHWWALAHHCLLALDVIHPLELVHLDIKGDNVCIPYSPSSSIRTPADLALQPVFGQLALIDFAFALISRASLTTPLPIGWQKDYDYQSPRLLAALEAGRNGDLQPTRELDWRCDLYSLAAMLKRYLPERDARTAAAARRRVDGGTLRRGESVDPAHPRIATMASCRRSGRMRELIELTGGDFRDAELALRSSGLEPRARRERLAGIGLAAHAGDSPCAVDTRHAIRAADCGDGRGAAGRVGRARAGGCADPAA